MNREDAEHLAATAAALCESAHYVQASKDLRPAYYAPPGPSYTAAHALKLRALGIKAQKLLARELNEEIDDKEAHHRALRRVELHAAKIAKEYGATITLDGDPRGRVLHLQLPTKRSNGFDSRAGWGV